MAERSKSGVRPMRHCGLIAGKYGSLIFKFFYRLQVKYFENMVTTHEQTVTSLEQENVHINRQAEERQLLWEQREAELERMIDNLERQQREIADAAVKVNYSFSLFILNFLLQIRVVSQSLGQSGTHDFYKQIVCLVIKIFMIGYRNFKIRFPNGFYYTTVYRGKWVC